MKKTITISALTITLLFSASQIISNPTGAPLQASGGPAEGGATCSQPGCHNGTPSAVTDILTTDIPSTGYVPGTVYNITATVVGSGQKGFMVSSQNTGGTFLGTLISGAGSKIAFTNYVTHSNPKSASPATWSFQWTAPAAGSGSVIFYGSFAITRSTTRTHQLSVRENIATGLHESAAVSDMSVFPNPVNDVLNLSFNTKQLAKTAISLVSIDGKISRILLDENMNVGNHTNQFNIADLDAGIYLLKITTPTGSSYQKVMIGN